MRALPTLLCAVLVVACGAQDAEPPAEAAETPAPAATAASPTLGDFAGTWTNVASLEGAQPVTSTLTGDASGNWTMSLEGRPDIPVQAQVVGDSLITQSAEYESVLRPGVMVDVRTAAVLQNGEMVGNMVANYRTATGTEQVRGTIRGTRTQ